MPQPSPGLETAPVAPAVGAADAWHVGPLGQHLEGSGGSAQAPGSGAGTDRHPRVLSCSYLNDSASEQALVQLHSGFHRALLFKLDVGVPARGRGEQSPRDIVLPSTGSAWGQQHPSRGHTKNRINPCLLRTHSPSSVLLGSRHLQGAAVGLKPSSQPDFPFTTNPCPALDVSSQASAKPQSHWLWRRRPPPRPAAMLRSSQAETHHGLSTPHPALTLWGAPRTCHRGW